MSLLPAVWRLTHLAPAINAFSMLVSNGALGHIVLNVADLKKSERFYRTVLGLKVSARNLQTKMTFMSYGREHHDIALQALPKGAKHVRGKGVAKLHHFCFYVDSQRNHRPALSDLEAAQDSGGQRSGDSGGGGQPLGELSRS